MVEQRVRAGHQERQESEKFCCVHVQDIACRQLSWACFQIAHAHMVECA
jgi:hypothetical protein